MQYLTPVAEAAHLLAEHGQPVAVYGSLTTPGDYQALVRVDRAALLALTGRDGVRSDHLTRLMRAIPPGRSHLVWIIDHIDKARAERARELRLPNRAWHGRTIRVKKSVDCDIAGHTKRMDRLTAEFHDATTGAEERIWADLRNTLNRMRS